MCGIAGVLGEGNSSVFKQTAEAMACALRSRGPDSHGVKAFVKGAISHRRLAIIDLQGGAQPLGDADGSAWITFNGEIYNYKELRAELLRRGCRLRTQSDTEVVLEGYKAWGLEGCLRRLRGMFAFAIWDERAKTMLVARDRVGIKPLVYVQRPGLFAFASELRALRALPDFRPTLDLAAIDLYLQFQYIPAPYTAFREARKLPPGHFLTVGADGRAKGPTRYWTLKFRPRRGLGEDEWLERLDATLEDAVRCHLVSDVPFGAFLSGGVDSSTVVAYMSRVLEEPVRTFSIGFQDEAFDETAHARTVARHVGAQHHEEIVNPDHLAILPELVDHYGEPFGDSSAVPTFHVSRLASAQVKMVLSGDGGDENFAGYPTYAAALTRFPPVVLTRYRRLRHTAANLLRAVRLWPTAPNGRDPREWWYGAVAYFREPERRTLWRPEYRSLTAATRQWLWDAYERSREPDLCSTLQHLDISTYLPFDILTKVDIASMCHGLEVRVPLLDHKLMEAVAEIPWTLKLRMESGDPGSGERRGPCGKYLLKRRAERLVPRDVVYRQKQGFAAPIGRWFQGPLRPAALERLTSPTSPLNAFFEPAELRGLVNANDRDAAHGNRLWAMLFLGEWLEKQVASTASTSWEPMAP